MSNFHPGSWNPAWSINTILVGLLSFMLGDEITTGKLSDCREGQRSNSLTVLCVVNRTTGSIRTSDAEKKAFAEASHAWNMYVLPPSFLISLYLTNLPPYLSQSAQPKFRTMFPEYSLPTMKDLPLMSGQAPPPPTTSAAIGAQTPVPPSSSDTRTEPNGVVLPSSETTIDDLRIAGGEGGERQGVLRRWRRELVWTLVVLLVSWACASLLAEA